MNFFLLWSSRSIYWKKLQDVYFDFACSACGNFNTVVDEIVWTWIDLLDLHVEIIEKLFFGLRICHTFWQQMVLNPRGYEYCEASGGQKENKMQNVIWIFNKKKFNFPHFVNIKLWKSSGKSTIFSIFYFSLKTASKLRMTLLLLIFLFNVQQHYRFSPMQTSYVCSWTYAKATQIRCERVNMRTTKTFLLLPASFGLKCEKCWNWSEL